MNINYYDEIITSVFFNDVLKTLKKIINIKKVKPARDAYNIYDYYYIIKSEKSLWGIYDTDDKIITINTSKKVRLKTILKEKTIIMYKPITINFFSLYELLFKFEFFKYNDLDILELSSNNLGLLESVYYYEKMHKTTLSNYNLDLFTLYSDSDNGNLTTYYETFFNCSISKYDTEYKKYMFENIKKKYDIIFSFLMCYKNDFKINPYFANHIRIKIDLYSLYYSLLRLKEGGTLVYKPLLIQYKQIADLIILLSELFESYEIFYSKIDLPYKLTCVHVIFFKYSSNKINIIKKLFEKYFTESFDESITKVNPSLMRNANYIEYGNTELTKSTKSKYFYNNENNENNEKIEFTNYKIDDQIYEKIKKFNEILFFEKRIFFNKLYNYLKLGEINKNIYLKKLRKFQLTKSILYAKEFNFQTINIGNGYIESDLYENQIMTDLYSHDEITLFHFKKQDKNFGNKIDIINDFLKDKIILELTDYNIDVRDIDEWNNMKRIVRFYRSNDRDSDLRKIIEKTFGQKNISQAWMKMYEILNNFNLIPKDKDNFKTFHVCESPGNFISAINHYIKTKTNIKKFDWYAQSLNPFIDNDKKLIPDNYGYLKKYPDKWIFGKDNTGNIMSIDNIKFYEKYCENVQLITSDCGISEYECNADVEIIKLHTYHLIFILYNLPNGGNFVAKMKFPFTQQIQIYFYYKCYKYFENIYFFKGNLNPSSKEFYFIGINYFKPNRSKLEKLLYISFENFKHKKLPESFLLQLLKIHNKFTKNYVKNFKTKLFYVDNYKLIDKAHFDKVNFILKQKNLEWITINKLSPIKENELM